MNRRVLVDGYQPSRSGGSWAVIKDPKSGPATTVRGTEKASPNGPTAGEKLPKTGSSVQVPKR